MNPVVSNSRAPDDAVANSGVSGLLPDRVSRAATAGIFGALAGALLLSAGLNGPMHGRAPFLFVYPVAVVAGYLGGWKLASLIGVASVVGVYFLHLGFAENGSPWLAMAALFLAVTVLTGWVLQVLQHSRSSALAGEAALRELPDARARFAALAQTSPDALWIGDLNTGRAVYVSKACRKLVGFSPEEICARSAEENWAQIHPEDLPVVQEAMKVLRGAPQRQTVEYECRSRHRDGSWRWVRNRAGVFAFNADRTVAQIFCHAEDVTERRAMTVALAQRAADLARVAAEREELLQAERAARAEAERANRLKDEFLATVSHELRTPLTAMLGWTAMLLEDAQDADLRHGLEVIGRNAKAQRQLIEDLLDMSRIMSGKLHVDAQPVLLPQIIRAAIETVTPAAEARGVTLLSQVPECEEPIHADPNRLQQIIWNLLSNAVKFTPAGGQAVIRAECRADEAKITVTDTGQGMAPEFVPHVFERFRQEDGTTTRKAGGLGLGLAIVKHLAELHGGTITAHSDGLGKGAVFTVVLPMRPERVASHFAQNARDKAPADRPSRTSLAGRRLLVIDDEADTRNYLSRVLADHGAKISAAESSAAGLRCALAEKPDAILCDISMAGEDGYSFIRKLRATDGPENKTPAAALTALARAEDRQCALEAGFNEHLAKPVEPGDLVALVIRLAKAGNKQ